MTIEQIRLAIEPVKAVSLPQIKRYLRAAGIKPLGARQKPQRYPEDSPGLIIKHLGFDLARNSDRLVSMRTLRAERTRANPARRRAA